MGKEKSRSMSKCCRDTKSTWCFKTSFRNNTWEKRENGWANEKKTHPNVVIDIDPIIVNILSELGFVTEITNLLPTVHRATRFEHGQCGGRQHGDTDRQRPPSQTIR